MNEKAYLSERLDDQIKWYSDKSASAQRWFKILRGFELLAAASIPVIAGFGSDLTNTDFIIAVIGGLIVVSGAFISLNQLQENWIEYRKTCETLKQEKYLYLTKSEPYDKDGSFALLVQRVEGLISNENSAWTQYTQSNIEKTKAE